MTGPAKYNELHQWRFAPHSAAATPSTSAPSSIIPAKCRADEHHRQSLSPRYGRSPASGSINRSADIPSAEEPQPDLPLKPPRGTQQVLDHLVQGLRFENTAIFRARRHNGENVIPLNILLITSSSPKRNSE